MGHNYHTCFFLLFCLVELRSTLGTKVEEASLLVPTELGKGVESLLEQDSKPNCQVVPFSSLCKHILLAARQRRGLWFQSTFVMCRLPRGVKRKWRDNGSCANFVERLESTSLQHPPNAQQIHLPSFFAAHRLVESRPSLQATSFHRN